MTYRGRGLASGAEGATGGHGGSDIGRAASGRGRSPRTKVRTVRTLSVWGARSPGHRLDGAYLLGHDTAHPTPIADELDQLVTLSNLIGRETRLVQPGGGNSSIKTTLKDGSGRMVSALLVKGSGTDLRSIGRKGFSKLSLEGLAGLRGVSSMSDQEMMRFMGECMIGRDGPAPSVETPLHSLLPHRVIVHTHDVATMSLTNVNDALAERLVKEVFARRGGVRAVRAAGLSAGALGGPHRRQDPGERDRDGAGASRAGHLGGRRRRVPRAADARDRGDGRVPQGEQARAACARPRAGDAPDDRGAVEGGGSGAAGDPRRAGRLGAGDPAPG